MGIDAEAPDDPTDGAADDVGAKARDDHADAGAIDDIGDDTSDNAEAKDRGDQRDACNDDVDAGGERADVKPDKAAPVSKFLSHGNFRMDAKTGLRLRKKVKDDVEWTQVSGPFEVIGRGRNPNGANWGSLIRWTDDDKRQRQRFVPDEALHGDKGVLCGGLARDGLKIFPSSQALFVAYLADCKIVDRVVVVDRTGWHDIGGHSTFALPSGTIGPADCGNVILDEGVHGPYSMRGAPEDWTNGVGKASSGHLIPTLAISTALAGPLLHIVGLEGGGIHLHGGSSTGKTTCAQVAASVWGRGDKRGFVRNWNATANGMEAVSTSATDTCLVLDEIGKADARAVESILYALTNGSGRSRMQRDLSLREVKNWRVSSISTEEITIEQKIAEGFGNKRAKPGQLVRMIDVPANRGSGNGAFDHDGAATADVLKKAAVEAYGTAGPEFVHRIVAKGLDETHKAAQAAMKAFIAAYVRWDADGQVLRGAQRFAVIAAAGELAAEFGIVPWPKGSATEAAAWALGKWIEGRGGVGAAEEEQAIRQVRLFLEKHGPTRFDNIDMITVKDGDDGEEREKKIQSFGFRDRAG